jgi:ADP-L-glycero-D-manno-heptose 6-epimerase
MKLVTGGAGFIGSVLVKELNIQGHNDIWIVDRLEKDEKWRNLQGLSYVDYIHADELFSLPDDFWETVTEIYHMGAISATTDKDVDKLWENNVRYSQELIGIATQRAIPIAFASSAATYGAGESGYDDDHQEVGKLRPMNPYGFSKQYVDKWILSIEDKPEYWFSLKFFNVFGPNEYHKGDMRSLVHKGFDQINENGSVKLFKSHKEGFSDGGQLRDFVYVKDVVQAMTMLMKHKVPGSSGIYNMGTGQARSFDDLIKATFKAMGKEEKIEYIPMPENLRAQYQYFTEAKMNKFHSVFPEFQFTGLESAVEDYVKEHLLKEDPFY